jgi:hypothetical protein
MLLVRDLVTFTTYTNRCNFNCLFICHALSRALNGTAANIGIIWRKIFRFVERNRISHGPNVVRNLVKCSGKQKEAYADHR